MKERLTITISDIHGSKQYTVHEVIKKILFWFTIVIFLLIFATYFYINIMNKEIEELNYNLVSIEEKSLQLKQVNHQLIAKNNKLKENISNSGEKLSLMNDKLKEIEVMVGIGSDDNSTFYERVDEAKVFQTKKLEKEKISTLQIAFLKRTIPNGRFLNYRRVSSKFGYRIHPVTKKRDFHSGLDLPAKLGTPIYAPADGVVEYAKPKGAYGNFLLIAHNFGFKTAYGHLSKYAVKYGQYVSKGDIVAYVGSTGRSTGPHLHFELRYLNKWLDPYTFIKWKITKQGLVNSKEKKVNWKGILKQMKRYTELTK